MSQQQTDCIVWSAPQTALPKAVWDRLETAGFKVYLAEKGDDPIISIEKHAPRLWVGEINGDTEAAFDLLKRIRTAFPELPIVMSSRQPSVEEAVTAIRMGVSEYISCEMSTEQVWALLESALQRSMEPQIVKELKKKKTTRNPGEPIAVHPTMKKILKLARKVAASRATILIQGESGTGKEVVARYIHRLSYRRDEPFIAVNCAALPENLLESELFGHEKGAFTGAVSRKKGKFELAHGGTLLLDEISEMDLSLQAKLLRVLQEREIDRVGGQTPVAVDVRVLATTNRDLALEVKETRFRQDLFYRLNVVPLILPPLRNRPQDILRLADHFLEEHAQWNGFDKKALSDEAGEKLMKMPWPGNVRELENLMERATLLVDSEIIRAEDLEGLLSMSPGDHETVDTAPVNTDMIPLREMEKRMIYQALDNFEGNRTHASKVLGISVRTLRNKLNEYQKETETGNP
jgi:two-component system response regulator FlrC